MGETYSRVASEGSAGTVLFWPFLALLLLAGLVRCARGGRRSWSLLVLATGLTAIAMSPVPRPVWIGREALWVCVAALAVLAIEGGMTRRASRKWNPVSLGALFPLLLFTHSAPSSDGVESLQLTREGILYSVATGSGGIIESSSMAVDGVDGLTIISEKRDIELKFGDWYQDEHGRYVSGAQLSSDIHGWIRTLRKQS